jgi:hypothetical protein
MRIVRLNNTVRQVVHEHQRHQAPFMTAGTALLHSSRASSQLSGSEPHGHNSRNGADRRIRYRCRGCQPCIASWGDCHAELAPAAMRVILLGEGRKLTVLIVAPSHDGPVGFETQTMGIACRNRNKSVFGLERYTDQSCQFPTPRHDGPVSFETQAVWRARRQWKSHWSGMSVARSPYPHHDGTVVGDQIVPLACSNCDKITVWT